jgi:O-antigen ligase
MAFIALLFYIITIYLRPAEWIPAFYGWQLLDILAFTALFCWLFTFMVKKRLDAIKSPQNILMLGLFLAFLMSHIVQTYFAGLMMAFTEFSKILIMYFLFVLIIDSERKFKIAVYLLIFLTLLLAIQGIQQFYTGYGWAGQPLIIDRQSGIGRITWISIFNDPNDLGLTIVIIVAILLSFLFGKTNFISKFITIPILACLLYAIYLTNSRGALLALMAAGSFYFVKRSKRFVLGAIVGIAFIFLVFAFGPSRLALLTTDEESAYNRVDAWYYGIQLTKSNPIFGVGYKMFLEDFPLTAHNTFVLAMAESGLLGLFFLVGLFYISFKGLSLVQQNTSRLKNYAYGLQAALVGFAAAAFFLSRLYIPIPYMLFALSASLFNVAKNPPLPVRERVGVRGTIIENTLTLRDIRNIGFSCIGVVALFYAIVKIAL